MSKKLEQVKGQIENVKKHVVENKTVYIASAASLLMGAASVYIYGGTSAAKASQQINALVNYKPTQNMTQVVMNFTERSTQSKPVHLVGTNLYFDSLSEAARQTGHSLSDISKVVNGHRSDIKGDVFILLQTA